MKRKLITVFYKSFRGINGYAITFIGLALTLSSFYFTPTTCISIKIIIPIAILLIILILTLFDASVTLHDYNQRVLPKVKKGLVPPKIFNDAIALLLLDSSPIFGFEFIVTIYIQNEDYETMIGIGYVCNIQENGLIQVAIIKNIADDIKIWDQIKGNDSSILEKMIVKPGSKNIIDYISENRNE